MTYVLILLCIFLTIAFSILCRLKADWNAFTEGVTIYRYFPGGGRLKQYTVVILGDHKYLANVNRREPYIRYDFWDYVKDLRIYNVYTEDHVDSMD